MKNVAAIDIGSNAARLAIAEIDKNHFRILKTFRAPLRLGEESFSSGMISPSLMGYAIETFRSFMSLIQKYQAENSIQVYSTSAIREANNNKEFIKKIKMETGLSIKIISGDEEADLVLKAVKNFYKNLMGDYLLMDIGGGSIELSYLQNGEKKDAKSFQIGTVRLMASSKCDNEQFKLIEDANKDVNDFFKRNKLQNKRLGLIGTGGNFSRLKKINKIITGIEKESLSESEFRDIYSKISHLSIEKIIQQFELKPDQSDVLKPALQIIYNVIQHFYPENIYLSEIGLIDGMLLEMCKE